MMMELERKYAIKEFEELLEQEFGETPVTFYGEGYGGKIQKGMDYMETESFILFDIMIGDNYVSRGYCEEIALKFNIKIVPILFNGTIQQGWDHLRDNMDSTVAEHSKEIEGYVGKPLIRLENNGSRIRFKMLVRDL